jgi:D-alanyl-D-alanine carboxypeptidase
LALPAHRHRAAGRALRRAPAALLALFAAGSAARAGTITARMRATAAAGNVHAKTGSIANVSRRQPQTR